MATINFELKKSKKNEQGKAPIYMRFTVGSSRAYKSTDLWIKPKRWNSEKQQVRHTQNNNDIAETYNAILAKLESKAKEAIRDITSDNKIRELQNKPTKRITPGLIKKRVFNEGQGHSEHKYISYARKVADRSKKEGSYNTYLYRNSVVNKFEEWISKTDIVSGPDISFDQITIPLIKEYYSYLIDDLGNGKNTAKKAISTLGTIFNKAIEEELVTYKHAPFKFVSFPSTDPQKEYLEIQELNKILSLDLEKDSTLWHIRNYFFFQIYTAGLRVSDLCVVTWDAIQNNRFEYTMRKTDRHKSLVLVPPALEILDKYRPAKKGKLIFPILKKPLESYNDKNKLSARIRRAASHINLRLKDIKVRTRLDKNLTTHMARHTFANMALKNGWEKYDIQKALGHSTITTTERYLSYFDEESIDSNMQNLFKNDWLTEDSKKAS